MIRNDKGLIYEAQLPETYVDAIIPFPFGTAGDSLCSHGLAIAEATANAIMEYRQPGQRVDYFVMGGWKGKAGLTEAALFSPYMDQALHERGCTEAVAQWEAFSLDTYAQINFFKQTKSKLERNVRTFWNVLVIAQEKHYPRCMWAMRHYAPDVRLYGIPVKGDRWDDNDKTILQDEQSYCIREENVMWAYKHHLAPTLSLVASALYRLGLGR